MNPPPGKLTPALLVIFSIALAGCAASPTDDLESSPTAGSSAPADGSFPDPADPGAAPAWAAGDWWTWNVNSRDSGTYPATTIVASATSTKYVVAWNDITAGLANQFFHFLPNNQVSATDFSFEAHNEPVTFFRFPIKDGSTWTGGTWLAEMKFVAHATEVTPPGLPAEAGFRIHGEGDEGRIVFDLLWSPSAKMFTQLVFYLYDETAWLTIDLVEFGNAYADPVHVLHRDAFLMRTTSVPDAVEARTAPPIIEAITIPSGATHYSMGCYVGGAPGRYEVAIWNDPLARNGCLAQNAGTDDEPLGIAWGELVGTEEWRLEITTIGQGYAFMELFLIRAETVTPAS